MSDDDVINDSQFYMWRALFAVVHADGRVTDEEVRFMAEVLEDLPFSSEQKSILLRDVGIAGDIDEMYAGITDSADQAEFFKIAHKVVHLDGDYGVEEQEVMLKLKELHIRETNVDNLIGRTNLQLEDDDDEVEAPVSDEPEGDDLKGALYSFRDSFIAKLQKK